MEMEKFKTIPEEPASTERATENANRRGLVLSFSDWSFEFVSDFGFRVSDFPKALAFGSGRAGLCSWVVFQCTNTT